MDDTRARADEDIALDSSRLRSSARLGSAASISAAATATVATTTISTSSLATTCRVARRKRKKRRRQRPATNNDDVAVASRNATTPSSNVTESNADAVVVLESDVDAVDAVVAANAATAGTDSTAARVDKPRSRLLVEQHTASEDTQPRVGGSGARAAASSVGTAGVTLLNRRAGKRSPRRCNAAGGRRSAMTMDLQRLINEVHARPAIWDQKNVNYHNRDVILKMWREIARACEVSSEYRPVRRMSSPTYPHIRSRNHTSVYVARTCAYEWLLVWWVDGLNRGCAARIRILLLAGFMTSMLLEIPYYIVRVYCELRPRPTRA